MNELVAFEILGNSAGMPTLERNVSAAIIATTDYDIMLDCGEGTYLTWRRAGYRWKRLKYLCITHLHPDHVAGIVPLLFYRHLLHIETPLVIFGPTELEDYVFSTLKFSGMQPESLIVFRPTEGLDSLEIAGGVSIRWALMEHKIPCYGYRFESSGGRILTFIADTLPCENGRGLAQHADVLIHEATFEPAQAELAVKAFHTTTQQALELAKAAGVRRLFLTHFSPRVKTESLSTLQYRGKTVLPYGKMMIDNER